MDENKTFEFNSNLTSAFSYVTSYNVLNIDTLKRLLKDHISNNKQIRDASNILYNANGIYTNVIDYMTALPTLDRVVHGNNKVHENYKRNKDKFLLSLKKMKDKIIARDIIFKSALEGTCFYYFEVNLSPSLPRHFSDYDIDQITEINSNDFNCSVIPLPTDYCRIVGRKNSSYVIAFDCSYFDQFTGNGRSLKLKKFPKEIRQAYRAYKKDFNKKWAVLDNNKTITNKIRSKIDEPWGRPIGLAAFTDMLYDEYFTETKRTILDDINSTIIYQTFPEGDKKGTSSLSQKQQKEQHENIRNALFSKGVRKGINFFSIASGTKLDKLTTDVDFLEIKGEEELITRISSNLGFSGSLLNGQGGDYSSNQANVEMVSAEIFNWIHQIQDEFNKVINANIIKDKSNYLEVYYLPITHANRDKQFDYAKDLYLSAGGSLQYFIASAGVNPDAYISLMEEEKKENYAERFPPHQTSHTLSNKDRGRSEETNPLNESTIKSKTNGSNNNPRIN
ncbi:hypothetical protein [Halalkalibacter oceani]|uniref:hypothetical protein n=1 Tax=Halalkalibacter oceani TaxID=1653776 RepID=UPI003393419F